MFVPVITNTDSKKVTFATLHMLRDTDLICSLVFLYTPHVLEPLLQAYQWEEEEDEAKLNIFLLC